MKFAYSSLTLVATFAALSNSAFSEPSFVGESDITIPADLSIDANRLLTYGDGSAALFGIFPNGNKIDFHGNNNVINVSAHEKISSTTHQVLDAVGIEGLNASEVILGTSASVTELNIDSDRGIMGCAPARTPKSLSMVRVLRLMP